MGRRILILGGTTEARLLAAQLAQREHLEVTLSLAGRTSAPLPQAVPTRHGGFGGVEGLMAYLGAAHIDLLIDATHPYATRISANAMQAARESSVPFLAIRRPPWSAVPGDRWMEVAAVDAAVAALGERPCRVFLALGRQDLQPFVLAPQHEYVIRSVDPVDPPLALPHARYILARGPFEKAADCELLRSSRIDRLVAKNSGGEATYSKIAAARSLGIQVVLVRRPLDSARPSVQTVEEALSWIDRT